MAYRPYKYEMETLVVLRVREGPGTSFAYKDPPLAKGVRIITIETDSNGWFRHSRGWSFANDGAYLKLIKDLGASPMVVTPATTAEQQQNEKPPDEKYTINVDDYGLYYSTGISVSNLIKKKDRSLRGIFGMPYQFLPSADARYEQLQVNSKFPYGREFTEKIVKRMPLLIMSPGKPAFMEGFSKNSKKGVLAGLLDMANGKDSDLEKVLGNLDGQYYSFKFDYKNYYDYVNAMCHASAKFLGIGGKAFNNSTYAGYNWSEYLDSDLKGFFSGSEYVCFYIESENQVSENFSNNTGESMLDSGLNKLSDMGKEVDFLMSAGMGVKFDAMNADKYEQNMEMLDSILGDYSNPAHVMERLKSGLITVSAGGQLIFPEIWKDSEYSKSYDITIKLISPDGDDESIYQNILVPMWHLLALVLPMQQGHNGYRSPFLVRGSYKGVFNCDMGIITNMSIRKGDEGAWNINGLPTEVEVTFTLKDLYQILSMTKATDSAMFVKNTQLIDFIANNCGININKPELFRRLDFYVTETKNKITHLPSNTWKKFSNEMSNLLMKAFK